MSKFKKVISSFSFNMIFAIIFFLVAFSIIISTIGYVSFTDTLKREYKGTTRHMANTATTLIEVDKIDSYLDNQNLDSYMTSYTYLKKYCNYMDITMVHAFKVNDDFTYTINIYNVINDKELIKEDGYKERERGENNTLNDSYLEVYKKLYSGEIEYGHVYRNTRDNTPHITTVVPIKDGNENIVALLAVQRPMSELANGRRPYIITIIVSTILTLAVVCTFAAIYIKFQFVKPIRNIMDESKSFAKDNKKGELSSTKKSRILEIKELSIAIDKLEDDMINYIESLTKATTEQKRMNVELNIAKAIQEGSVPNVFPAFPDRKDFDLFASMHPAKAVGGDFYNFALIDDSHLALIMADVSGKGVPAALFMMVSNILLTERLRAGDTPADALNHVNDRICARNTLNMFVTMWVGILDLTTGKIVACNAGHDDPAICKKGGKFEIYKEKHGIIVGAMTDINYENYEIDLAKGDKIFLYTDGVVEATNSNNELFKEERMLESLNKHKNKSPKDILKALKKDVDAFVGDAPQFDDITMLCVELKIDDPVLDE